MLVLDMLMLGLNGTSGQAAHLLFSASVCVFYCLNPIPCLLCLAYSDYFIHHDSVRLKRYALPATIPAAVLGLFSIASLFGGFLFQIGSGNIYDKGPLFFIVPSISHFYILFSAVLIVRKRNQIRHKDLLPLLLFAIPPFLAGVLHVLLPGLTLLWIGFTISLLLLFLYIQSTLMNTDHLTELFNRREYDRYLDTLAQRRSKKNYIAGIILDLDYFKRINDIYGHSSGDTALIYLSEILRKSFGGDEFAVILELNEEFDLIDLVERLEDNILSFNDSDKVPYDLSVSIGFGLYRPDEDLTLFDFFHELDSQMYEAKKKRRLTS